MATDEFSIHAVALERVNETMMRMDERWYEAIKEMRADFKTSQDKTDAKFEKINETLAKLVAVDTEVKEFRECIGRAYKRIEAVEHNQNTEGCSAHKSFLAVRAEQLKQYDALAKECQENHNELEQRIEALEQKPAKAMDKVAMGVLGALGAGFGGWILIKFGIQTK